MTANVVISEVYALYACMYVCMYVCMYLLKLGQRDQTTFGKYQSVLGFGAVCVLRKNHVFDEHVACS